MKMRLVHILWLLLCSLGHAQAGASSAQELAAMMRTAQYSEGFEARMSVSVIHPDGARDIPFKVAVVGQANAQQQRLLLRGIEPAALRGQHYAVERTKTGAIKAVAAHAPQTRTEFVVYEPLFNSGLVMWDMFSPWWDWPQQALLGTDTVNGQACIKLRSVNDNTHAPIRTVESCIAEQSKLSLRTRWFDARHTLLRSAVVQATLRKADGAGQLAKQISLRDASGRVTEISVYAGDEQYQISPETFNLLDATEGTR